MTGITRVSAASSNKCITVKRSIVQIPRAQKSILMSWICPDDESCIQTSGSEQALGVSILNLSFGSNQYVVSDYSSPCHHSAKLNQFPFLVVISTFNKVTGNHMRNHITYVGSISQPHVPGMVHNFICIR